MTIRNGREAGFHTTCAEAGLFAYAQNVNAERVDWNIASDYYGRRDL